MDVLTQFAQAATELELVEAATWQPTAFKALGAGLGLAAAAMGLGWIGSSYMKALGRNPEAGKAAGQIIIIAAMVEVTALLTFLLAAFLIA